jgi:hypothetical protein
MTCTDRIITVLKTSKRPLYLHEIRQAIVDKWGEYHSETAISARIRAAVRNRLQKDRMMVLSKAPQGKRAHQYRIARLG